MEEKKTELTPEQTEQVNGGWLLDSVAGAMKKVFNFNSLDVNQLQGDIKKAEVLLNKYGKEAAETFLKQCNLNPSEIIDWLMSGGVDYAMNMLGKHS